MATVPAGAGAKVAAHHDRSKQPVAFACDGECVHCGKPSIGWVLFSQGC